MESYERIYQNQGNGAKYILRKSGAKLTLNEITANGERLVADKTYYNNGGIMRRGYDSNGGMYRHSTIGLDPYGYRKFDVRDFRSMNPETLATTNGFHLQGWTNNLSGKITKYTGYYEKNIIPKVETWKDLGPLAKRYLAKALEFAKIVK